MIGKISIQTKMLLIIVPLIIVPKLILAIVGVLAANSSLLICLAVCRTLWSHADHVGQNSSQNGQDVVKIFRL